MPRYPTVFAQLLDHLPKRQFRRIVDAHGGNHRVRNFSCWDQYLCMSFAQLTGQQGLRGIEACLRAMQPKLYHLGIRGKVSRSTLADANESRDWRIFARLADLLIKEARALHAGERLGVDLDGAVYAFDATIIKVSLGLFPWADWLDGKAGVKLNTLMDLRGSIPSFITVSNANRNDVIALDGLLPEPGATYVMDRGYLDFRRLRRFADANAWFVIRPKKNMRYQRIASRPVEPGSGVSSDQTIRLAGQFTAGKYPMPLRRVGYRDPESGEHFLYLTNNFLLPARTIADIYRLRWRIELFFKWIKQHLRIRRFYGTSENAVRTQIWIAVSVYVLVAIVRKKLQVETPLSTCLQVIATTLFEQAPVFELLSRAADSTADTGSDNQLNLFDS